MPKVPLQPSKEMPGAATGLGDLVAFEEAAVDGQQVDTCRNRQGVKRANSQIQVYEVGTCKLRAERAAITRHQRREFGTKLLIGPYGEGGTC